MKHVSISFLTGVLIFIVLIRIASFNSLPIKHQAPDPTSTPKPILATSDNKIETARVTRIVDGDTIEINGNVLIRYIGINTPETMKPNSPVECYGHESSDYNSQLVLGKTVFLEKDVSKTDRYGRLLRYVYIVNPDNPHEQLMVNKLLVQNGYAYARPYPPDIAYQDELHQSEQHARDNGFGLWGTCLVTPTNAPTSSFPSPTSPFCIIKGNINTKGEKLYHIPGCKSYEETIVSESKGEHWFCTEQEAVNAGWVKAGTCPR